MNESPKIELEVTSDGSHTLFVPSLDEHYHSVNGAIQESEHVFIDTGFRKIRKDIIHILEIGFGTGLNTFLTFCEAKKSKKKVHYTTLELYPLSMDLVSRLNYADKFREIFEDMHRCDWNQEIKISDTFYLHKIQTDFSRLDVQFENKFDLIYFDAFAPDKQPEMWTQKIFDFLYKYTENEGILTTYCAKGVVRRMMQQAGYTVERIPGPPGKREILRALKL